MMELVKERYLNPINIVEIGALGSKIVRIGGESTLPFLFDEGDMPNAPITALEILDCEPSDWPEALKAPYGASVKDPVKWAEKCVKDFGSQLVCVRLQGAHPDYGSKKAKDIIPALKAMMSATGVPLIICGSGDNDTDNDILPEVSQALKGANCLFGIATQNNYKTLTATCLADGHSIIAESPIDVNIAKQVNILISDMGFDPARIVMHPMAASLGYGMEYTYSIMERSRLAAFSGDKMLATPLILFVGAETWKVKESKEFGERQGINWEITTAISMLQAGGDLLVMRHPAAAKAVTEYIDGMMRKV